MFFFMGKCGFTQESMRYLIGIHRIPDDSSVDSLNVGMLIFLAYHFGITSILEILSLL
jgi:hypothetical protein